MCSCHWASSLQTTPATSSFQPCRSRCALSHGVMLHGQLLHRLSGRQNLLLGWIWICPGRSPSWDSTRCRYICISLQAPANALSRSCLTRLAVAQRLDQSARRLLNKMLAQDDAARLRPCKVPSVVRRGVQGSVHLGLGSFAMCAVCHPSGDQRHKFYSLACPGVRCLTFACISCLPCLCNGIHSNQCTLLVVSSVVRSFFVRSFVCVVLGCSCRARLCCRY